MATKYVKLLTSLVESDYSDYAKSVCLIDSTLEATPDEAIAFYVDVPTTGLTLDLGMFDTITGVLIHNVGPTNYVDVTYTYDSVASKAKCLVNDTVKLGAITVASDLLLTANTGTVACRVYVWGA